MRRLCPDALGCAGNRSILPDEAIDGPALRHCIAPAMTCRLRKKQGRAAG